MSNFPRRSPRFQTQSPNTQAPFASTPSFSSVSSQASSAASTSHPSPANDVLNVQTKPQNYPLQIQSQFLAPDQAFNAPLPSPSANDIGHFIDQTQQDYGLQNMGGPSQNSNTGNYQSNNGQAKGFGGQQTHHHNSFSQPQPRDYPPPSVNGVPPGLPPDFLAEAAKRAQMACLMRDLGDVSL